MEEIGKPLIILGIIFLVLGILFNTGFNIPRLPGDIYIDRPGLKVYIPITSAIIISAILTLVLSLFRK